MVTVFRLLDFHTFLIDEFCSQKMSEAYIVIMTLRSQALVSLHTSFVTKCALLKLKKKKKKIEMLDELCVKSIETCTQIVHTCILDH